MDPIERISLSSAPTSKSCARVAGPLSFAACWFPPESAPGFESDIEITDAACPPDAGDCAADAPDCAADAPEPCSARIISGFTMMTPSGLSMNSILSPSFILSLRRIDTGMVI